MKKIGTISAAIGFIFLGIWMILRQANYGMAEEMFKWWPIIIVILGCEVFVGFNKKEEYEKININLLIIPVILIFIAVNVFISIKTNINKGFEWFQKSGNIEDIVDNLSDIDVDNYKVIASKKEFEAEGKEFIFDTDNSDIIIKNSSSNKIIIEADIYVKKNSNEEKYEISYKKDTDGYKINMDESYIKKVKAVLYIPQNLNVTIKGNNSKLVSEDSRVSSSFNIDINNGSLNIENALAVKAKINNAKIDIKDTETVDIDSNNGIANLKGKVQYIDIEMNNGVINVDNEICNNVNIKAGSGTVKFNTSSKDIDVKLELDHGTSKLNDERSVNSGQSKTFGKGSGKLKVEVRNGFITFTN
jgi:hypothetical protein